MITTAVHGALEDALGALLAALRNGLALFGLAVVLAVALVFAHGPVTLDRSLAPFVALPGEETSGFVTGPSNEPVVLNPQPEAPALVRTRTSLSDDAREGITRYLAHKYHLSPNAIGLLVDESATVGREFNLDPTLILAVMAIESGFNPFAESGVGAQGLMQVMAKVHEDKFDELGGTGAVLDPATNIRIGAAILKDCIRRGGSIKDGLRLYVGATGDDDGGYGSRVLQEQDRIEAAARAAGAGVQIMKTAAPANGAPALSGQHAERRASVDGITADPDRLAAL